jgi:hypothetical protein
MAMVGEYSGDSERFAREVLSLDVSDQQELLLANISRSRSRTSVASGHGTGKTTSIAAIVIWHLACYLNSVTLLTANDMDQLKATLWKEIGMAISRLERGPFAWLADYIEVLADGSARIIGFEKTWFVESKTANAKNANKMAGRHGEWFLVVVDEASTVPDEVMTTLTGALTERHNRMLLTSQPTRNAGYFYRTHHDLSVHQGGDWIPLVFSSLDSPFVSDAAILEFWKAYDDDQRRIRLLGLFPEDSSGFMMARRHAESMYKRGRIIQDDEAYGWFLTADIGGGEGERDKSAQVLVRVIGRGFIGPDARRVEVVRIPYFTNNIRNNVFHNYLYDEADGISNPIHVVDAPGVGLNTCQSLEDKGAMVHRVWWGKPCFQTINKNMYLNLRAQASHQAARAAKEGRLSILTNDFKSAILDQSSRIPKVFSAAGKIQVPPKHSPEWDGVGSPDLWDAICFAFLEGLEYIPADNTGKTSTTDRLDEIMSMESEIFGH